MGQKIKIFALYYEEDQEADVIAHMKEVTRMINEKFIELTNPFTGRPREIRDLVEELLTRSTMHDEQS